MIGGLVLAMLLQAPAQAAAPLPQATEADFVMKDFRFASGETLPELRIHYRTLGTPKKNAQGVVTNAVLIMHGTGGTGAQFTGRGFAGELFGPGQPLDTTKYYIVLPDDIGHGKSSKPSDGLRAKFPRYGYQDMLTAEHRLLTEGLGVNHLRLVMGTSMGGMHTWLWGERWPDFMDALMPLASGISASMKSGQRCPQSHVCIPPIDVPITRRRWLTPSPSVRSRCSAVSMS